ncbi:MAG: hypothetical protein C9356_15705 [Oleiphilus sp.]|nr:MAG: hypothetical protein C9356_15705 [Oleiphilus sp.]
MKKFIALAFSAHLVGCTGLGLQESSDFSCQKEPGTNHCLPASKIYELSEGDGDLSAAIEREKEERERAAKGDKVEQAEQENRVAKPDVVLPTFEQPQTLMNLPLIVRVWVAPYEDERRNLLMPGYMIVKAKDWSWSVGEHYETFVDTNIYPLQMMSGDQAGRNSRSAGRNRPGFIRNSNQRE